ncbi:ECF transporter S component [Candidatus Caldatribacterium sp. SIUC1]|uniref:ECF transporter S component n=1 Tax=Candidatus Caldatribacterium sp. SIUC1 TaxID=3418365 RepID=UPI003F690325
MHTRDLTKAAVLLATGIVLPSAFHLLGLPGRVFLPMHIPPLLGGFLLSGDLAFLLGFVLPPLNFLVTGMPPFPGFLPMMFELGTYGLCTFVSSTRLRFGALPALVLAMLAGRGVSIVGNWVLFAFLGSGFNLLALVQSLFVAALPGIVVQLVLIPVLVKVLGRWRNVPGPSRLL